MHRYLVDKIADRFSTRYIEKEYSIGGGKQVDLVIDRNIAVEVETKLFSEFNVIKDLQYGFSKVVVVCYPNNLESFKKRFTMSGIDDPRVQIMTTKDILTKKMEVGNELL